MTHTHPQPHQNPKPLRRSRLRHGWVALGLGALMHSAVAAPVNSALDSRLFLQILAAEMYVRANENANAFQIMLEAARQQREPDLYRRAVNIALQSGSGGSALMAARAWGSDWATSDEAAQFELQILLALNRVSETGPVLRRWVLALNGEAQVKAIQSIPNLFSSVKDKPDALRVVRRALSGLTLDTAAAVALHTSWGRMALAAGDGAAALQDAQTAHRLDRSADWPALLALALMEQGESAAEALVSSHTQATAAPVQHSHTVALAYARVLINLKRWADAQTQLQYLQQRWPEVHEKDPDLAYEQANMAEKLGQWDDMERLLRGLIQNHPTYAHAYNALGYAWADRNVRLAEAKVLIEQAVALAPEDGYILDSLGWVEFRLGNHSQALAHLKRAFELKADAEIAAHWGEVLWVTGDREQALVVWRKGLSLNAENATLRNTLKRFNAQP